MIECVCDDVVACERLERDAAKGDHPAANRNAELYRRVKSAAEPLAIPCLVLDTGQFDLQVCLERAREFLRNSGTEM